jgi:ABC-type phosphate transport system substrate-binding protein
MKRRRIIFCFSILLLLSVTTYASRLVNDLRGPAFSDPSKIQEMPDAWKSQPIKYEPAVGDADVTIALDQQMYPALSPSIKEYAKKNNLKIAINEGTCGITTGMLSRKATDIAGVCCPPDVTDRFPGVKYHTIGVMPLVIFVHPDNPIDNITLEQARQIYQGEIIRWSELKTSDGKNGPNMPIQPVTRLHCKIRPGHWRLLLDNEELFTPGIIDVGAIPDMIAQVAGNQRAIGFETYFDVQRWQATKGKVKPLKINGYTPEPSNLLSLNYSLYHVYSLGAWEEEGLANPKAQKLVDYLLQQGEHLDKEVGLIPASQLKKAGWKFKDRELIGEPK